MKNKSLKYIAFIMGVALFASCSKKLELTPNNLITSTSFWKTEDDAKAAVGGMYARFRFDAASNLYIWGGARSAELGSGIQASQGLENYYNNTVTKVFAGPDWAGLYSVVQDANLILKNVPGIAITNTAAKKTYMAQAYAMRAYMYFIMARTWGGVPIVKTPTENPVQADYIIPRNTVQEVFTFIKADLDSALANYVDLNAIGNKANISKPTVLALQADIYLWTAKMLSGGTVDLNKALDALNTIPGSSGSLLTNFDDVFRYANKGNAEILFAIRFANIESPVENWNSLMFPGANDVPANMDAVSKAALTPIGNGVQGGILRWQPNNFIKSKFAANDLRRNGSFIEVFNATTSALHSTAVVKYRGLIDGPIHRYYDDIVIYRFADVLLMKAEIKNALGQDPKAEMDAIRTRAGQPLFVTGSQSANNDAILEERLKEFAFEGKAWWDYVRFGKAFTIPSLVSRAGQNHLLLWPISENTISLNPKIVQNPGY
jgi:starch-binding outer membrane protein, SusD/RagB family